MKTKIVLIVMLIAQCSFAQKRSRADRFFENGDYINAAAQYEEELNQEGYTKHILENIATSYYNTFQFRESYRYLKILTAGKFYEKDKSYDHSYDFMMYQVLSALGSYDKAIDYLESYLQKEGDEAFSKMEAIAEIEAFKLKEDDYEVKNISFNSDASEFGAVKKDSSLYFVSDRNPGLLPGKQYKWTHRSFLDIYRVTVDENNNPLSEIEGISPKINSSLHEGNFCFTADGNTLYFSKNYTEKGKKKFDSLGTNPVYLYTSKKIDGVWQEPESLPFNVLEASSMHPALSQDESTLYFSSNRAGGLGDFDIYKVAINQDGTYGTPSNLGDVINTKNREQFPFISKEGHLFFSSNGHLGLGMMDVFVSEYKNKELISPINLGAPINSSHDDFSLSYSYENTGFFASNRKNKTDDDIYAFTQIGDIFPKEYLVRFEVKDFAKDSLIQDASITLKDNENASIHEDVVPLGALDKMVFPGKYEFKASAQGYEEKSKLILVSEKEEQRYVLYLDKQVPIATSETPVETSKDSTGLIKSDKIGNLTNTGTPELTGEALKQKLLSDKVGPPVVEKNGKLYFELPPIYFDYDKWNIRADSKKVLDEFALKLEKYKSVYIKISSHTDSRGTDTYNQVLSEKRAESTRNYLALIGYVNARRMQFAGYGESQPLIDCEDKVCTEEEHQLNRRSEFEIVKY